MVSGFCVSWMLELEKVEVEEVLAMMMKNYKK